MKLHNRRGISKYSRKYIQLFPNRNYYLEQFGHIFLRHVFWFLPIFCWVCSWLASSNGSETKPFSLGINFSSSSLPSKIEALDLWTGVDVCFGLDNLFLLLYFPFSK